MQPLVYILLPVHNRLNTTKEYVENLKLQTYKNYILVLIDDGSTDGTTQAVNAILPNTINIIGQGKWWWGGSLQKGYLWLKNSRVPENSIILISNDDIRYYKNFIETGVKLVETHQKTIFGALEYNAHSNQLINSGFVVDYHNFKFIKPAENEIINCLSTRGLFIKYNDLMKIGGFYPILLPHYGSDYEFTMRAFKKGYSLRTNPELILWMDDKQTGLRQISHENILKYLKTVWTKRSTNNPLYKSMFLIISFRNYKLPYNLLMIWYSFFKHLWISTIKSFS